MVRDLERRVRLSKANVESIKTILSKWCEKPLYQRKDDKKDCLLNLEVSTYRHTCIYKYINMDLTNSAMISHFNYIV